MKLSSPAPPASSAARSSPPCWPTATRSSSSPAATAPVCRCPQRHLGPAAAPRRRGPSELDGADAVINLAGESIAGHRWTAAQKQRIAREPPARDAEPGRRDRGAPRRLPPCWISGSAVGYYGPLRRSRSPPKRPAPDTISSPASACDGRPRPIAGVEPDPRGLHPHRARARARRRGAAADAAAVLVRRRRAGRIRPPVLAVDSSPGLDRPCALRSRLPGVSDR